jgi:hypothetical protein
MEKIDGKLVLEHKSAHVQNLFFKFHKLICNLPRFFLEYIQWERASFDAIFNLVGAVRDEPTTLKDVAMYYEPETSDMLWQATGNLRGMLAVTLTYGFEERLFGLAEARYGGQMCELSEDMFPFVYCHPLNMGKMMIEYLNYAKDVKSLLPNTEVPVTDSTPSSMRQGNLRADGVI